MPFYKDVNSISPTVRPDVTDVDAITLSILNLLRTSKGEIPFNPDFGVNIRDFLFELGDDSLKLEVLSQVFDAINEFLPRVEIRTGKSDVEFFPDENRMELKLVFNILGFDDDDALYTVTENIQ